MSRDVLAWVPVRGTFWSGVSGGCVTRWILDGSPMSTLAVRTRVSLGEERWLPGDPSDLAPEVLARVPTLDDGVPIKDHADVRIDDGAWLGERAPVIRVGDASLPDRAAARPGWAARESLQDRASVRVADELEAFQLAAPEWRSEPVTEGARLGWDVAGSAGPSGVLDFAIGAMVCSDDAPPLLVEMICDSIALHVERGEAELIWRGIFLDPTWGEATARIVIGVLPRGVPEDAREAMLGAGLARAVFTLAANAEDIEARQPPPALGDEALAMARMTAWEGGPGEPTLGADEFAEASSELSLGPRHEVLARLGFDEISWGVEEWAQGERAADESLRFADGIDDDLPGGVEKIAPPPRVSPRASLDLEAYARLSAHLAVRDPGRVLAEARLSVGELIAIDREMQGKIDRDAALAAELERLRPTFHEEVARAHEADFARLGLDFDLSAEETPA